jgi:hypothetical protein
MRARLVAVSVLVLALAGACGGDKKSDTATTASSLTSTTLTSTTAAPAAQASNATLDRLVLVSADFPPGWTSTPGDSSKTEDDKATEEELNKCTGTSGTDAEAASKSGDDFAQGENLQAGSEASLVKDETTYKNDLAALRNDSKVSSCVKEAFTNEFRKQFPGESSVDMTDLSMPRHGDVTLAKRLTVSGTTQGQTITVYVDVVLMGKNRYELTQTFFGIGSPFDASLEKALVDKVGERLDAV